MADKLLKLPTSRRRLMRVLILVLASTAMLNARGSNIDVAEWNEEVKLSDGTIVTVSRKARAYSSGFPNARRGRDIDFELNYAPLHLSWRTMLSPTYVRDPVSFDIIDGIPHLTLFVGDREYCRNRPGTDYTAQFLRWIEGRWVEVPQAQFPVDRATVNLSGRFWGHTSQDDYKGLVQWETKRLRSGTAGEPVTIKTYFERAARNCDGRLKN
jgi:hypothetical protein